MSDRRRLRSGLRSTTTAAGSTVPEELARFRPHDWSEPGDVDNVPAWRRQRTAFFAWANEQGWTRRQALGTDTPRGSRGLG